MLVNLVRQVMGEYKVKQQNLNHLLGYSMTFSKKRGEEPLNVHLPIKGGKRIVNYDRSLGIYESDQRMKRKRRSRHDMIRLEVRLEVGWGAGMYFEVVTLIRGMRTWKGRIGTSWVLPLSRIGILLFDEFEGVCRVRYSLLLGGYLRLYIS
jgi:hypothetical protein